MNSRRCGTDEPVIQVRGSSMLQRYCAAVALRRHSWNYDLRHTLVILAEYRDWAARCDCDACGVLVPGMGGILSTARSLSGSSRSG